MEVKLQPFDFASALARAGLDASGQRISQAKPAVSSTSFGDVMGDALKSVSQSQAQTTHMQRELQLDNPSVSLEDTMISMQKSQIGFQAVLQVRNRLVSAYSEIMNMQV